MQGIGDVAGNLLEVKMVGTKESDINLFRREGTTMHIGAGEVGLGDRAYIGCEEKGMLPTGNCVPIIVAPPKEAKQNSKKVVHLRQNETHEYRELSEDLKEHLPIIDGHLIRTSLSLNERNFGKFHQIIRSPIERAFSRLHQFKIMKWCPYGEDTTLFLVHLVALADAVQHPQFESDHVKYCPEGRSRPNLSNAHSLAKEALSNEAQRLARIDQLRGRNSRNRKKAEPERKSGRMFAMTQAVKIGEKRLREERSNRVPNDDDSNTDDDSNADDDSNTDTDDTYIHDTDTDDTDTDDTRTNFENAPIDTRSYYDKLNEDLDFFAPL